MADFLTTKAVASQLEEIIKKTTKRLFIVTPYLKLSNSFYERLSEATEKNIETSFVYGKNDLSSYDDKLIRKIKCDIYYKENLHAKCYANEDTALITSMNLHSFSEANNREFGILITKRKDLPAFNDCINEIESIIKNSEQVRIFKKQKLEHETKKEVNNGGFAEFLIDWQKYLTANYPNVKFNFDGREIQALGFPANNVDFSTKFGFVTLTFNGNPVRLKTLKEKEFSNTTLSLRNYRFYWNGVQLSLYHAKETEFTHIQQNVKYCAEGLKIIISELRRMNII